MTKLGCVVAMLASVAACGKKQDDCEKATDKLIAYFESVTPGKKASAKDRTEGLAECREAVKDPTKQDAKDIQCVLAAADNAAVAKCMDFGQAKPDLLEEYGAEQENLAAAKSEAELQLSQLGKAAKRVFAEYDKFAEGTATQLPAAKCCGQPKDECPPAMEAFIEDKVWRELDFSVDEPSHYRYRYTGTATEFTATAIGDLDCDGTEATYTLKGSVTMSGDLKLPHVDLTKPTGTAR